MVESTQADLLELECKEMVENTCQSRLAGALNHQAANQTGTDKGKHPAVLLFRGEFVRNTKPDDWDVVSVAQLHNDMAHWWVLHASGKGKHCTSGLGICLVGVEALKGGAGRSTRASMKQHDGSLACECEGRSVHE